jgi:hypothetical protein
MYDFEARQSERARDQAQIEAKNRETDERLNESARKLGEAINKYSQKFNAPRQSPPQVQDNKVYLRSVGDPSGAGVAITLNADGTYDIAKLGVRVPGSRRETKLDKIAMMDRVLDWLAA